MCVELDDSSSLGVVTVIERSCHVGDGGSTLHISRLLTRLQLLVVIMGDLLLSRSGSSPFLDRTFAIVSFIGGGGLL